MILGRPSEGSTMRIAVTGSIANDYLMTFPGRFSEQLVGDQLERLSLSFLVDELEIRRGGAGANIAFGLGVLGLEPLLVGAVGLDFGDDYGSWLRRHGVDTSAVRVSETKHTARFLCTTDTAESQIASFYTGAMAEARFIELGPIAERTGGLDLVVVSPNDPEAMLRHTEEALALGVDVVADPSQQLARMEGPEIRMLVDGAAYLVGNDYERALCQTKTGWSDQETLRRVGVRVTTHGAKGATLEQTGEPIVEIGCVAPAEGTTIEPTGAGDAFRAGLLGGLARGLDRQRSVELGCLIATLSLESVGPQEYRVGREMMGERLTTAYGPESAAEILGAIGAGLKG
jgi:adenosine kinase